MRLGSVQVRSLAAASAWLVGAGAATGGSLFAVSVLGQGIAPAPSQQLTMAAVNHALAGQAAEAGRASASPTPVRSGLSRPRRHQRGAHAPSPAVPAPTTVLASAGGTVVAQCLPEGVYLATWSPQQAFQATQVVRGPAVTTQATFTDWHTVVTMTVTCANGVATASTRIHGRGNGHGDGSGNGGTGE
ncbi:MAG TPA: hypothetical protein VGS19_02290 [Streptosporangiaceae bacterium]|nr:hypothetical protein [Streptosporangiaceae bacterium]